SPEKGKRRAVPRRRRRKTFRGVGAVGRDGKVAPEKTQEERCAAPTGYWNPATFCKTVCQPRGHLLCPGGRVRYTESRRSRPATPGPSAGRWPSFQEESAMRSREIVPGPVDLGPPGGPDSPPRARAVTGLSKEQAEHLLDWLEAHGCTEHALS